MKKVILVFSLILFLILSYNLYRVFGGGRKSCFSDEMTDDCYFLKDKFNVYYKVVEGKGSPMPSVIMVKGVDTETFEVLGRYFGKDEKFVYGCFDWSDVNGRTQIKCRKVENVDLESFESINDYYVRDKNNVYYLKNEDKIGVIENADSSSFQVLDKSLAKDENNFYHKGKNIDHHLDISSIEIIDSYAIRDKNYCYFYSKDTQRYEIDSMYKCNKEKEFPTGVISL